MAPKTGTKETGELGEEKTEDSTHEKNEGGEQEKTLTQARSTAKMVFTKKVKFFNDRVEKGDPYEALEKVFKEVEIKIFNAESCNFKR